MALSNEEMVKRENLFTIVREKGIGLKDNLNLNMIQASRLLNIRAQKETDSRIRRGLLITKLWFMYLEGIITIEDMENSTKKLIVK